MTCPLAWRPPVFQHLTPTKHSAIKDRNTEFCLVLPTASLSAINTNVFAPALTQHTSLACAVITVQRVLLSGSMWSGSRLNQRRRPGFVFHYCDDAWAVTFSLISCQKQAWGVFVLFKKLFLCLFCFFSFLLSLFKSFGCRKGAAWNGSLPTSQSRRLRHEPCWLSVGSSGCHFFSFYLLYSALLFDLPLLDISTSPTLNERRPFAKPLPRTWISCQAQPSRKLVAAGVVPQNVALGASPLTPKTDCSTCATSQISFIS